MLVRVNLSFLVEAEDVSEVADAVENWLDYGETSALVEGTGVLLDSAMTYCLEESP